MGIQIEFNPDLCLRAFGTEGREREECLPETLKADEVYPFLKKGQRNYWLEGKIPLLETKGESRLSRPLASITILEVTHFAKGREIYTRGLYRVNEVYNPQDKKIHFEGMNEVKE
ncbi:MAG TPA: hypothetical protein VMZ91_11885 [Candidatus Paceibacterota bacterium]|nr:hypothetical protein [Candidatus Paceibacterota bacterium]